MAMAHVLGASIQTALLNAPLVVLVGWGLRIDMDYNFAIFDAVALVLAVLVVGSFLRDGKSNYLEGTLCIMVYIIIFVRSTSRIRHTVPPQVALRAVPRVVLVDTTDNRGVSSGQSHD